MGKIWNLDTDELVIPYRDGTVVVMDAGEMGEIALSRDGARELARQLLELADMEDE